MLIFKFLFVSCSETFHKSVIGDHVGPWGRKFRILSNIYDKAFLQK